MTASKLEINTHNNLIYLAKFEAEGLVTLVAQKLEDGIIEITYFAEGVTRIFKSASLLASRVIASMLAVDYFTVNRAMEGVI